MSDQPEWLDKLEEQVKQAARRLTELAEEKATLESRVAELEKEIESEREGAASAWQEERDAIRGRVEGLVGTLEELLAES